VRWPAIADHGSAASRRDGAGEPRGGRSLRGANAAPRRVEQDLWGQLQRRACSRGLPWRAVIRPSRPKPPTASANQLVSRVKTSGDAQRGGYRVSPPQGGLGPPRLVAERPLVSLGAQDPSRQVAAPVPAAPPAGHD